MTPIRGHASRPRGLRADAHRWIRPDCARFLKPGTDPADVYPALTRQRDAARRKHDRAIADTLEQERAVLDELRRELADINAELKSEAPRTKSDRAFDRFMAGLHTLKYSPSQPRVPAGNGRPSGQWTSSGGGSGRPRVVIDTTTFGEDTAGGDGADSGSGFDFAESNPGFDAPGQSFGNGDLAFDGPGDHVDLGEPASRDAATPSTPNAPASGRPRVVISRVISDADPELVRPGEQYAASIRSLRDANGNPLYREGGHHEYPRAEFNKLDLPPETRRVFDAATTGTLSKSTVRTSPEGVPLGHYWDKAHRAYNKAVNELGTRFIEHNGITPSRMTPAQAAELLVEIRQSDDPRIRDYNSAMRMLSRIFRFRYGRSE